MGHSYTNITIHALFSTKGRQPWLGEHVRHSLFPYMAGIVKHLGAKPLIINGVQDHVHSLVVLPAQLPLADLMEKLKANSSRWIHQQSLSLRHFAWQTGYAAFSVSQSNLERVRTYIETQETHHRKMTYQEEVATLLRKHGIEPNPRDEL